MLSRLDLRGCADLVGALTAPRTGSDDDVDAADDAVLASVRAIIADVRARGDVAVRELTERFDGCTLDDLRVPGNAQRAALDGAAPELRVALEVAADRIREYHAAQLDAPEPVLEREGIVLRELAVPVARAGCYVPGGRAAYPSTVLMTVIPAQLAGVDEVVLCVPPAADGTVPAPTLAAAALAGVTEVYRIGGAQAIAALAYGTETIRPVDVIVGPGNRYVALAKREVAGTVGIDSFAGPSEVVVVADGSVPAAFAAADLLAQAEHGPGGSAVLVTWDPDVADATDAAVDALLTDAPRRAEITSTLATGGRIVLVDDALAAIDAVNVIAPEHLELLTVEPAALLPLVRNAGAVFLGPWAPAALGDYVAGVNHVLPTARTARFASALRVDTFRKHVHVVEATESGLKSLAPHIRALAAAEGLDAHARSVDVRGVVSVSEPGLPTRSERPMKKVSPRDDLRALEGYHSPQLDVAVRLNTNESPFAPPPAFVDRWVEELRAAPLNRYPDRAARELREALGQHLGQPTERLFCANGSNEVLQTLLLTYGGPGRRAAMFEPTYALHSHIAHITGTEVVVGERRADFSVDPDTASALIEEQAPTIVFVCSPNNPTGTVEPAATIEALLAAGGNHLVVVDEAYGEFAPWSALELVRDDRPLVVVRTYSKVWSMAALRLGFAVAPAWVIEELDKVVLPYHLASATQIAGRLALDLGEEMDDRVQRLVAERDRVAAELDRTDGITVYPSGANFLLFRPDGDGHERWQQMVDHGVLVRDFSRWPRLEGCLRVTIGTPEENDAFLAALRSSLQQVGVTVT